jgi:hypothetical protein
MSDQRVLQRASSQINEPGRRIYGSSPLFDRLSAHCERCVPSVSSSTVGAPIVTTSQRTVRASRPTMSTIRAGLNRLHQTFRCGWSKTVKMPALRQLGDIAAQSFTSWRSIDKSVAHLHMRPTLLARALLTATAVNKSAFLSPGF